MKDQRIQLIDWGLIDYERSLSQQQQAVEQRHRDALPDSLFVCEHPDVVTVGRALREQNPERDTAIAGAKLAGIPIVEVRRGGQATLHCPGQIVGYPVLKLDGKKRDIRGFLRVIEHSLIDCLDQLLSLKARREEGYTGVWVEDRKIASIGVAIDRWVSYHGFALNVVTELSRFQCIVPCGLSANVMTSVEKECGRERAEGFREEFSGAFLEIFTRRFGELGGA